MSQVLLFSLTAMLNPTLVAATTVMLILPSPEKLMLGYLLGALLTSVTLGLVIVFVAQGSGAANTAKNTINPIVDFTLGAIVLAVAFVLETGRDQRLRDRRRQHKAAGGIRVKATPRWQRALNKGDLRTTFLVGVALTLPGASYLVALSNISRLNYNTLDTVLLVLLVNLIMLALIEVPLISFTIAPDWTPTAVERVKASFARNGHTIAVIGSAAVGGLLIVRGLITVLS